MTPAPPRPSAPGAEPHRTGGFRAPRRVADWPLARAEKRLLVAIARRLPGWVSPDRLTALALVAALVTGAAYALTSRGLGWLHVASLGLAVHWFGDSLDGTLARVRRQRRERYGYFVDHQADAAAAVLILGGLALSSLMRPTIALALLAGYLLMMALVHAVALTRRTFRLGVAGVGPTEVRIVLVAANTAVWATGNPAVGQSSLTAFDGAGLAAAVLFAVAWVVSTLAEARALNRLDPPPPRAPRRPDGPSPR